MQNIYWERTPTSCSSFSSFSCSSTKYLEVTRPFWDLSRQSLASSTSWCWMNPSTPSARGRAVPGEHSARMSSSRPSIWAVAWETTKMEDFIYNADSSFVLTISLNPTGEWFKFVTLPWAKNLLSWFPSVKKKHPMQRFVATQKMFAKYRSEREQKKMAEEHRLYLRKAFFVDMIHHDNLIVKCSTGPPRAGWAEAKERSRKIDQKFNGTLNTIKYFRIWLMLN